MEHSVRAKVGLLPPPVYLDAPLGPEAVWSWITIVLMLWSCLPTGDEARPIGELAFGELARAIGELARAVGDRAVGDMTPPPPGAPMGDPALENNESFKYFLMPLLRIDRKSVV